MTKSTVVSSAICLTLVLHVISAATTSFAAAGKRQSAAEHHNAKKATNNRLQTTIVAFGGSYYDRKSVDLVVLSDDDGNNSYTNKSGALAPGARSHFASAVVNDTVYIISGINDDDEDDITHNLWSYNIVNDSWNAQDLPASPMAVIGGRAAALDGTIYVTSGQGTNPTAVHAFDVANSTWSTCRGKNPRFGYFMKCLVAQNQSLFHFDGQKLLRSDDKADSWQEAPSAINKRFYMACTALGDDAIIVTGGNVKETDTNSVEIFNLTTNSWKTAAPMQLERYEHSAVTMPDGKHVLVCGGSTLSQNGCEMYDSNADKWTVTNFTLAHDRRSFGLFVSQTKDVRQIFF